MLWKRFDKQPSPSLEWESEGLREDESGDGKDDDELVAVKETGAREAGKVRQKVISAKSDSWFFNRLKLVHKQQWQETENEHCNYFLSK